MILKPFFVVSVRSKGWSPEHSLHVTGKCAAPCFGAKNSLVPRPRPAFRRLQYGKAWRAWYLFSREHNVIGKWRKFVTGKCAAPCFGAKNTLYMC